jgi:hypothetical protein
MSTIVRLRTIEVTSYFGGCPKCGGGNRWLNVGPTHWICCEEHKLKWSPGSNLFSGWREESDEEWRRNDAELAHFREVEPLPEGKHMGRP